MKVRYIIISLVLVLGFTFAVFSNSLLFDGKSLKAPKSMQIKKGLSNAPLHKTSLPLIHSSAPEIEPNNGLGAAQQIVPPSPSTIEGSAEISDVGELVVTFTDGSVDDLEDIYEVTINSDSIMITLTGVQSDLDLWLIDSDSLIRDSSTLVGVVNESIDNDTLEAGTYFIGVSIFDPAPGGPSSSNYILTVTANIGVPTSVEERDEVEIPTAFGLGDNYPNPFNPSTQINYDLAEAGRVVLKIYNALGQEIVTLVDEIVPRGAYVASWGGRDSHGITVASGLYFYTLNAGKFSQTKKMLLMK